VTEQEKAETDPTPSKGERFAERPRWLGRKAGKLERVAVLEIEEQVGHRLIR
jgi:hypothetical protein